MFESPCLFCAVNLQETHDEFLNEFENPEGTPCVFTVLSADTQSVPGKTLADMSLQRFHMQHIESAKHILSEIAKRKQVEAEE